jgi:hypothetical protein
VLLSVGKSTCKQKKIKTVGETKILRKAHCLSHTTMDRSLSGKEKVGSVSNGAKGGGDASKSLKGISNRISLS